MGYKEGCNFRIGLTICKKTVPILEIKRLLVTGKSAKLRGFISKSGKIFSATLVLKDNNVGFSFD
jgi:DNA topoisomerase-3